MTEEMFIVEGPGWGNRDFRGQVGLWFTVSGLGGGALQCFFGEQAAKVMKDSGAYNVADLNGKACVCEVDGPAGRGTIQFVRWH